jgi:hypothetical protein
MAQRSASRLLDLDPVDQPDRHDEVNLVMNPMYVDKLYLLAKLLQEMGKCYEEFLINTSTMSMNELHAYVHDTVRSFSEFDL